LASPARPPLGALLLGFAFAVLAVAWPIVSERIIETLGVRPFALGLALLWLAGLVAARGRLRAELGLHPLESLVPIALALAAAATGAHVLLLLLPVWVYAALSRVFAASLRGESSLVEQGALLMQPNAPDFIRPYCRAVTRLWATAFALNALLIAALALAAPLAWWRAYTGWITWLVLGSLALGEFVVRKVTFRNYDDGPLDRLFELVFPADGTEMSRRANAYKGAKRRSLGRAERERRSF
jgi:uncharacterized membrane protein